MLCNKCTGTHMHIFICTTVHRKRRMRRKQQKRWCEICKSEAAPHWSSRKGACLHLLLCTSQLEGRFPSRPVIQLNSSVKLKPSFSRTVHRNILIPLFTSFSLDIVVIYDKTCSEQIRNERIDICVSSLVRRSIQNLMCSSVSLLLSLPFPQGSKKKNLNKQEMCKYLRFIVQRMKERVRIRLFLPVLLLLNALN